MLTIKEIAKRANVSRTTVSRVLNDSGYVSEKAKTAVMKAINETGYVPSPNAKSLRTKKTKVIGVILPKISTETSSRLVKGIDDVLVKDGYQILLTNTNLIPEKEIEFLRLLKGRHVDGIILSATNSHPELIQEIDRIEIPFVAVGQLMKGHASVIFNDYQATKEVTDALIKRGHEKIAFIGVEESDHSVGLQRKSGYLDSMKDNQLPVEEFWVQKGIFDMESGYASMKTIQEQAEKKPTAVIAVTDRLAIGAMQYLKEEEFSIPEDIGVVGMGGSELSQFITPSLTTIDFSIEDAGREAASLLLEKIDGKVEQEIIRFVNHRFLERDSI